MSCKSLCLQGAAEQSNGCTQLNASIKKSDVVLPCCCFLAGFYNPRGASIVTPSCSAFNPFSSANNGSDFFKGFVGSSEDVSSSSSNGSSSYQLPMTLHHACATGNASAAAHQLAMGVDVNAPDTDGATPLHLAAACGCTEVMKLLLAAPELQLNTLDSSGRTPLHHAAARGAAPVIKLLAAAGADVNACDSEQATPLHHAAVSNHAEATQELLSAGAVIDAPNSDKSTALHITAEKGHLATAKVLVKAAAACSRSAFLAEDVWGCMPLELAANEGHSEVVEMLADYYSPGSGDALEFALCGAAARGCVEAVRCLIAAGEAAELL